MSQIVKEILSANAAHVAGFDGKSKRPLPPGRRFAILTAIFEIGLISKAIRVEDLVYHPAN